MHRSLLLASLVALACLPAPKAPTALELAIASVNLTDAALAAAIEASPPGGIPEWERRTALVNHAREVLQKRGDLCAITLDLALVASLVSCSQCLSTITELEGSLQCL